MAGLPNPLDHRKSDYPIETLFLKRWSPRAMSGEAITQDELMSLFEAARWAPSTYNEQEWRFLYAHRETDHWQTYFDLLMDANQTWCVNAGVLIVVASHNLFERSGKPNAVHTFDAGAAFQNLVLQAAAMGLVAHGMAGFYRDKARSDLKVPDDYTIEAMIAIGRPGNPDQLPTELREREVPTGRNPIDRFTCEGPFSL